jgi:AcrR family transcriptional regulator
MSDNEQTAPTGQAAALLEAAARIVANEGVGALSTRRLAAEVGTSTMGVYTWFGSKPNLLRSIFRESFRRFAQTLRSAPATASPLGDLMAMGWAYRRYALENPHLYDVMFGASSRMFEPDDEDLALGLRSFTLLVESVGRCVETGALACDPPSAAHQIWAAVHGAMSLELVRLAGWEPEQPGVYAALLRTLLIGLGADPEAVDTLSRTSPIPTG